MPTKVFAGQRKQKRHNSITSIDPAIRQAQALEVWHLRSSGMSAKDVALKLGLNHDTVTNRTKEAAEFVREQYADQAETHFEQALAQIDAALAATSHRIQQSMAASLDIRAIERDLESHLIKPFLVERYYKDGRFKKAVFEKDVASGSPELRAIEDYMQGGRVDILAVEAFRKASESKRKLLGLDRDKQRIEVSGMGGLPVPAEDITDKIAEIAERHRLAREIEVKGTRA